MVAEGEILVPPGQNEGSSDNHLTPPSSSAAKRVSLQLVKEYSPELNLVDNYDTISDKVAGG